MELVTLDRVDEFARINARPQLRLRPTAVVGHDGSASARAVLIVPRSA
ncbi:MAG TPA: hypothetical protein VJU60_13805 [Thermoleophilaceae bacterium]|nr:hypothetical protein [Thermoleophilaceae bacterium]